MKEVYNHRQVIVNKPWGYEYLMYENDQVAMWLLHIANGQQTSMHCHPIKTTGLVLLKGEAELSFLADKKLICASEKQMIRRGLFHSTKAVSDGGIFMLEIETPNDKNDLVRLSDEYGRADSGYETSDHEMTKTNECVWLEDPELNELHEYNVNGAKLTVERSNDIELLNKKNDNDIIVFLRGGLGKHIDGRKHLATMPGDVGRVGIVKKVAREMDFLEEHTTILTIPVE
jgi:quercetin dioxygenase-like cupin family protein